MATFTIASSSSARACSSPPTWTGSKPASRINRSVTSRASSSDAYRLLGATRCWSIWSYRAAKLTLNAFATGPPTIDFTSCASDLYARLRPADSLVASIATLPSSPRTLSSASAIAPDGTATRTTSASDASPPSRPIRVMVCPARSQRRASPPPTFPLPMTVMFMRSSNPLLPLRPKLRVPGADTDMQPARTSRSPYCARALAWASRVQRADGRTSPEELLAASHATCYAMALNATLGRDNPPQRLEVTATVSLDPKEGGGFQVTSSALEATGVVPGLDQAKFQEVAEQAEQACPISNALRNNLRITVKATLEA